VTGSNRYFVPELSIRIKPEKATHFAQLGMNFESARVTRPFILAARFRLSRQTGNFSPLFASGLPGAATQLAQSVFEGQYLV
jgi:hypothetical protein